VREQLAELVDRVDRIESDDAGVAAHPGSRVNAARPALEIAALDCCELLAFVPRLADVVCRRRYVFKV
jgi:hypothetical protein